MIEIVGVLFVAFVLIVVVVVGLGAINDFFTKRGK